MPIQRATARKLLSSTEFGLFEASRRERISLLSVAELKRKVDRTRRLRDKYVDLFKRQGLAMRKLTGTKLGNSGAANTRTQKKAAIFQELLTRFQVRHDRMTSPPKPAAKKAGSPRGLLRSVSPKAPASLAGVPIGSSGFISPRARQAHVRMQAHKSRGVSINAHTRAQGRRNQAKRDRR